jgi:hypothetical protein
MSGNAEDFTIARAEAGEHVRDFAKRMLLMARAVNGIVLGEFNQYTLEAQPCSTLDGVTMSWDEAHRRSYFGGDR